MRANLNCRSASLIMVFSLPACSLGQTQSVPSVPSHELKIEALARQYNQFRDKDWKNKRDFCLGLMDDGVIGDVTRTADVRHIFARDLHYHEATDKLPEGGVVRFGWRMKGDPNIQNRSNDTQARQAPTGWRFEFESSANGYLSRYCLTNCGK
jgi:hypothetical protein